MLIGIPKEIKDGEYRAGMTPEGVASLASNGHRVLVQQHAGLRIGMTDETYRAMGADIVATLEQVYDADLIVKVKELQPAEYEYLKPGQLVFTYLHAAPDPELGSPAL